MSVEPLHSAGSETETVSAAAEAEVRHLHSVEDSSDEAVEDSSDAAVEQDADTHAESTTEEGQATVEEPVEGSVAVSESESAGRFAALTPWLVQAFTPCSGLYTERQPTIAETVRRARDGDQLPDSGPLRLASQVHGYGHAAFSAAVDTAKWLTAHPARLAVLFTLLAVALAFPTTRHMAGFLLTPFAWAHTALV